MTLAIGDGANDVSMLQAADVGVGVRGVEGMQAVMASDYAVTQFRHLSRLLLVHGRWSYHRSAETTLSSFHKNIAFVVAGFWYQWSCAFTSSYIYDYMYANFFNILLAMPPILCLGCFDQDVGERAANHIPQLYRQKHGYSLKLFSVYMLNGLWQSLACFFIARGSYAGAIVDRHGHAESRTFLGNAVGISVIVSVNAFVLFNTRSWNVVIVAAFLVTMLALALIPLICSFIPGMTLFGSVAQLAEPRFHFILILAVSVALCPQLICKLVKTMAWPSDVDVVREACKLGRLDELIVANGAEFGIAGSSSVGSLASTDQPPQRATPSKLSRTLSTVATRIRRRLSLSVMNMGNGNAGDAGRMQGYTGYAFSQQDRGTGSIIMPGQERGRSRSPI
jgi:phospholipid-translocating ATPase